MKTPEEFLEYVFRLYRQSDSEYGIIKAMKMYSNYKLDQAS